ncbi:hypothetical protein CYK62_00900 [Clostridium perfringens]|nr:hypothetical protein CYK62_00900 [Clostridium perfringens]
MKATTILSLFLLKPPLSNRGAQINWKYLNKQVKSRLKSLNDSCQILRKSDNYFLLEELERMKIYNLVSFCKIKDFYMKFLKIN